MIVTHAQNAEGHRRIYLGGKASIECWIEPKADGVTWSFHLDTAATGTQLDPDQQREWAVHTLLRLAQELNVSPHDLSVVPFEQIAALHHTDPFASRRVATPRRQSPENGFKATCPHVRSPSVGTGSGQRYRRGRA